MSSISSPLVATNNYVTNTPPDPATEKQDIDTQPLIRNKRGVAITNALWPQHSTLKISLANVQERFKETIKEEASKLLPHINLKFEFTDEPEGDIRVTTSLNYSGAASAIGNIARLIPADEPTMRLSGIWNNLNYRTSILHEFCHAIGLHHEHQHPDRTINFNKDAILKGFALLNQGEDEANKNVLFKLSPDSATLSPYSEDSIMHYSFHGFQTTDNKRYRQSSKLSESDISFLNKLYPPETDFSTPDKDREDNPGHHFLSLINTLTKFAVDGAN